MIRHHFFQPSRFSSCSSGALAICVGWVKEPYFFRKPGLHTGLLVREKMWCPITLCDSSSTKVIQDVQRGAAQAFIGARIHKMNINVRMTLCKPVEFGDQPATGNRGNAADTQAVKVVDCLDALAGVGYFHEQWGQCVEQALTLLCQAKATPLAAE